MNDIISFCGIDIRKVGEVLHCSTLVGRDRSFTADIDIGLIRGVYFRTFDHRRRIEDKPFIAIRAVKSCGVGFDTHRFYIPAYLSLGESECEAFVSGIKEMIGMKEEG